MNQTGWDRFIKLCLASNNAHMLSAWFELFLTHEEKENLALRYLIIEELFKQEKTQRDIAQDLQVSIAKTNVVAINYFFKREYLIAHAQLFKDSLHDMIFVLRKDQKQKKSPS